MPIAVHSKLDIALEHLHGAIILHLDHHAYFAAIHLAGAASELFDGHLPKERRTGEIAWRGQKALHLVEKGIEAKNTDINAVINGAKNAVKHMNDRVSTVKIDAVCEANWYIENALNSFEKLGLKKTLIIWRFLDYANSLLSGSRGD
jgi:hypothetical protein